MGTQDGSVTARPRRAAWRPVRASFGSGLLSGICCVGGAIATAAGLGVAGFFGTLMDRYQLYFILAGVVVMVLWLARQLNRSGISPRDVRAAARLIGKHALVMGVVYAVTLGIAMGVARLVTT